MKRKYIILIFSILILFATATIIGCGQEDEITEENSFYLPGVIEPGNLNDLTLTIYYMSFWVFTEPVRLERLIGGWCDFNKEYIRGWYDYKAVVAGRDLIAHRDLINQLFATELKPTETEFTLDAHLYYVFEHKEYGEIFSFVARKRLTSNVLVNGIEVEHNDIFYEFVLPFLPEDIATDISDFVWPDRRIIEIPPDILESVHEGNLDGIRLMIFYTDPLREGYTHMETVYSQDLTEHRDLIGLLFAKELNPSETESALDAHFQYAFFHGIDQIFMFSAFPGSNLRANGIEVAHDDIFFEAVLPFLPEDIAEDIRVFLGTIN